jgi:hypothetical protein
MATRRITVTVAPDGSVEIETTGYRGKVCMEEAQFLKDLLGREVAVQLCPTYYQRGQETVKKHVPLCG